MTFVDAIVALVIAIGLAGIIVPALPGTLLIIIALLGWAIAVGETIGWVVFAIAVTVLAVGIVLQYLLPGRSMKRVGVPNRTLFLGAALGVVGFFVIPVIGLAVGFVLGVYLSETHRVGQQHARGTTKAALKAVAAMILIEFTFAVLATFVWIVGVALT